MSLLIQLARSFIQCTVLIPRVAMSCRHISFRYRPRVDPNEQYHLERQEKSLKGTKQTSTESQEKKDDTTPDDRNYKNLSMWEHHARMYRKCPEVTPRMDDLYYTATDNSKRVYKQTWVDYPDVKITKKPKYDMEELDALSDRIVKPPSNETTHASSVRSSASDNSKSRKSQIN